MPARPYGKKLGRNGRTELYVLGHVMGELARIVNGERCSYVSDRIRAVQAACKLPDVLLKVDSLLRILRLCWGLVVVTKYVIDVLCFQVISLGREP